MASADEAGTQLEISDPAQLEQLIFEGADIARIEDPIEIQRSILRRIFQAETPEQLFQQGAATPWQELLGVPVEVLDVRISKSGFTEGADVFVIADAVVLEDSSKVVLTCGGINVLGQLFQAKRKGWLPMPFKLVRAERPSAGGFYPLWLEAA